MEQLPRNVRERLAAGQSGDVSPHPDADTLNAFAENALLPDQREQVLGHIATCAECRDVLSFALPQQAPEPAPLVAAVPKHSDFRWMLFRWAGAAVAVIIVSTAVLLYKSTTSSNRPVDVTTAPVTAPASVPTEQAKAPATAATIPDRTAPQPGIAAHENAPEQKKDKIAAKSPSPSIGAQSRNDSFNAAASKPKDDLASAQLTGRSGEIDSTGRSAALKVPAGAFGGVVMQSPPAAPPVPTNRATAQTSNNSQSVEKQNAENSNANYSTVYGANANTANKDDALIDQAQSHKQSQTNAQVQSQRKEESAIALRGMTAKTAQAAPAMAVARTMSWRISDTGTVERSMNGSWEQANPAANVEFRAIASSGRDVWAGGKNGTLYHSSDAGRSWARSTASAGDQMITGDVVHITLRTPRDLDLTTSTGQLWTTHDGGQTWDVR